jgi:hypothetical protein
MSGRAVLKKKLVGQRYRRGYRRAWGNGCACSVWATLLHPNVYIPVNIHVADHPSCWRPLDSHQERPTDFQVFNLYEKDVPSYAELLHHGDRMLLDAHGLKVSSQCLRYAVGMPRKLFLDTVKYL